MSMEQHSRRSTTGWWLQVSSRTAPLAGLPLHGWQQQQVALLHLHRAVGHHQLQ